MNYCGCTMKCGGGMYCIAKPGGACDGLGAAVLLTVMASCSICFCRECTAVAMLFAICAFVDVKLLNTAALSLFTAPKFLRLS